MPSSLKTLFEGLVNSKEHRYIGLYKGCMDWSVGTDGIEL